MAIILKDRSTALTAILEPSDGKYVVVCPELDLATEGDTPEAAFDDLLEMVMDYAEQYRKELDRFAKSPNRAAHAPFIKAIHELGTKDKVKTLFT